MSATRAPISIKDVKSRFRLARPRSCEIPVLDSGFKITHVVAAL